MFSEVQMFWRCSRLLGDKKNTRDLTHAAEAEDSHRSNVAPGDLTRSVLNQEGNLLKRSNQQAVVSAAGWGDLRGREGRSQKTLCCWSAHRDLQECQRIPQPTQEQKKDRFFVFLKFPIREWCWNFKSTVDVKKDDFAGNFRMWRISSD